MTARTPHALLLSGVGHALVALLAVLCGLASRPSTPPVETIFHVLPRSISVPSDFAGTATDQSALPSIRFTPPLRPVAPPAALPPSPPVIERRPLSHPSPSPVTTPTATRPASVPRAPRVPPAPIVPSINVEELTAGLRPPKSSSTLGDLGSTSAATSTALESYFALLKTRALAAFVKPPEIPEGLVTAVSLQISAVGVISNVRVVQSSGHRAFDAAVLAAFSRLRLPEKPDRRAEEISLSFRTADLAAP